MEMNIQAIGPWVLLGVGTLALLAAVKQPTPKGLWMPWVFGFAIAGVGVYGPVFLHSYSEFVKTLLAMQKAPSPDTYADVFQKVGSGDIPPDYGKIALSYSLERPVEGMDQLLETAIQKATDPQGKQALIEAKKTLEGKQQAAEALETAIMRGTVPAESIRHFDPATRSRVARPLLKLPDERLRELRINRDELREFDREGIVRPPGG
jgi:hypothetical protein